MSHITTSLTIHRWPSALSLLTTLISLVWCNGCEPIPEGVAPPRDELYNPLGVAAHPQGRYLFVTNSVFNRQYRASTLTVIDTFERVIIPERTVELDLFAGEITLTPRCTERAVSGACPPDAPVIGLVPSRDTGTLSAFKVTLDAEGIPEILCGQSAGASRCGGRFVQASLRGEGSDNGPFSLSTDARGAYLTHITSGFVSRWEFNDIDDVSAPLISSRCQVRQRGAYFVTQHPITATALVSDLSGRALYQGELSYLDPSNDSSECELQLIPSVNLGLGGGVSEAHGVTFSADGSQLYSVDNAQQSLKVYQVIMSESGAMSYQLLRSFPLGSRSSVVRVAGRSVQDDRDEESAEAQTDTLSTLGGGLVYVTSLDDQTVTVIDPRLLKVVATISVGAGPHDVTFMLNREGALRGYVSLFQDNAISVLDLQPGSPSRFTEIEVIR